jgi:hypothetical protein
MMPIIEQKNVKIVTAILQPIPWGILLFFTVAFIAAKLSL